MKTLRIAMVAGELSGDKLGANLLQMLYAQKPALVCEGVGGEYLHKAGMQLLYHIDRISVMAIAEVLWRYPRLKWLQRRLIRRWKKQPPDIFIGVDAPDFNLKIARALRRQGVRTIQYVSPKVWAWRSHRVALVKEAVDAVLCLFPFEVDFYKKHGIPAYFVGHPLATQIPLEPDTNRARNTLNLAPKEVVVCLMPGSRKSELQQHTALFIDVATRLQNQHPDLKIIFALPNEEATRFFYRLCQNEQHAHSGFIVHTGLSHHVLAACDVALIKSGTSTLEALLFKKPMVVAYRCHPISYHIIKRKLQIAWISLPNILAGQALVKEHIQHEAKPKAIAEEMNAFLSPDFDKQKLIKQYQKLHQSLQSPMQNTIAELIFDVTDDAVL